LVRDDQGNGDIQRLDLEITRPDEVNPDSNVFVFAGHYEDNGIGLDTTAGDGVFAAGFSADSSSRTGVLFTFTWTPVDWALQNGEPFRTTLVFLRDEGAAVGRNDLNRKSDLMNLNPHRTKIG
jgi:hypothetical protein